MKRFLTVICVFAVSFTGISQLTIPENNGTGEAISWATTQQYKAAGDSCGAYFNNYIGLVKTSVIYWEYLRTGNFTESGHYAGRAQHFTANQPIEISGIQFYAFESNLAVDSVMAITILHDYTAGNDSVGVELARDTVWVTHQAYTASLPNLEVNSYFDTPVTVTSDYMVTVLAPTDDSIKIIVSSKLANDGAGEGNSFLIYENPAWPGGGYYNGYTNWGAAYDLDYLINPRIKYDLFDPFGIVDDTICPGVVSAGCFDYTQKPVMTNVQYNGFSGTSSDHILWLYGDGFQNTNALSVCHTYNSTGTFDVTLRDTLKRHDLNTPYCPIEVIQQIEVLDTVLPNFTSIVTGMSVDFTNTSTLHDSIWWDFGDATAGTDNDTPTHVYAAVGTYDVWLHGYNECSEDSIMIQVTIDDVSIEDYDFNFKVYPNPANSQVTVNGLVENSKIDLINIIGETVISQKSNGNSIIIDTDELSNGSYFIKVSTDYGQVTKKLIVRH